MVVLQKYHVRVKWDHQISHQVQKFQTNPQRHMKWRVSMPFIFPKSLDCVEFNDNEKRYGMVRPTAVSPHCATQHRCDIFISKGSYKFWSTRGALSKRRHPLTSFRIYKSLLPQIENHEVLPCLNGFPRRNGLPGIGRWCLALCVLSQSFTNLTLLGAKKNIFCRRWTRCTFMWIYGHICSSIHLLIILKDLKCEFRLIDWLPRLYLKTW